MKNVIDVELRDDEVIMDNDDGFWWYNDWIFFDFVERFENVFN